MKLIEILLLSLLASCVVSELSMEQRRKRAASVESKEKKKQTQKRAMKAYREVVTGSISREDSKMFFSLVPQRLVRRHAVRFITIILSRIQWQNCATHYDPRYCRQSCANGQPIGNCPKCPEGDQSEACVAIRKERECLEKVTFYTKNDNPTDSACCKYSMTQDVCERRLNPNQIQLCCKEKTYQQHPLCQCSYVLYHQSWFLPERVIQCCSEYEVKNNRVHPLCKTHCSPLTKDCCAVVFKNPINNWILYGKCCKEFSTDPACDCNTIVEKKSIGLYPEEKFRQCCESFLPNRIPETCRPSICPTYQLEKQECCSYYFLRKGVNQAWIQNCCKHKEYSSLDACEDCDCRNNVECCDKDPYKSTEFCTCYRLIGKGKEYKDEYKDCFCKVYPNHPLCTCGNDCCSKFFYSGDYSDKLKYKNCCAHPSVNQVLKDKYCECNENTNPAELPENRKMECCINKGFILIEKNKPACCSYVLSVLDNQYIDESYKKQCCLNNCDEKCKSYGYCGDECKEDTVVSEKCCLKYQKRPHFYKNLYTDCCRKGLLNCKCEYIYSHIDEYGLSHPMVQDCCKRASPTPDTRICASTCNPDQPQNELYCCHLIVGKNLESSPIFKDCCKIPPYDKTSICQTNDCSTSDFKYPCCSNYIGDYLNRYQYYKMCCAYEERLNSVDKTKIVNEKCGCAFVLQNQDFFKKNDPARLAECDREDCIQKYGEKVCNCHDKYKRVPLPAGTIEECCEVLDNPICNDCDKLLKYLPALKNNKLLKSCCQRPEFNSNRLCETYDCDVVPFHQKCCSNYFANPNDYSSTYNTGSQLARFNQFRAQCCYYHKVPNNFQDCPKPDCSLYPTSLACCNTYDASSKYRQECCLKNKQEFPDLKGICLCSDNRRANDAECCKYGLDPSKCCTGYNPTIDYSDTNRHVCCAQRFNPQFCCFAANWESLSLDQKKQCCAHSYIPGKCCKVTYSTEHCCNSGFFTDECCKDDNWHHIDTHAYRLKCCSQFRAKLNEKRSKQVCEPCIHMFCGPIYPPICTKKCPMTREQMIKENCQCPDMPDIIIPPNPPLCDCPSNDPLCNCPPICPECPHKINNQYCKCDDDKDCIQLQKEGKPLPHYCDVKRCEHPYTDHYEKDGIKIPCIRWPYLCTGNYCTYPLVCLKPPCFTLPPRPPCKGSACCFKDHRDDREALNRCLCKYPEHYSREVCTCVLTPNDPKCDCLLPNPAPKCCLEKDDDLCTCAALFRKYGSIPLYKKQIYEPDQAEWEKCCNKYQYKGFCLRDPPLPPPEKCSDILAKSEKSTSYLNCCMSLFINSKGNDQVIQGEAYKACCRNYYPGMVQLEPFCKHIPSCSLAIIKDKKNKDKAECCSIYPYRNYPECNVCNQACVYQPPSEGPWHSKFVSCCNNYPQKKECCLNYDKVDNHPLKNLCCERDPHCCANGQWKTFSHPSHQRCCEKNLNECCPLEVQADSAHPDHLFCCARLNCPAPPKCKKEDYKKDSPTQCKCCKETYIPELCCECSDCYKTYLAMEKDIKKFDVTSKEYVKCCLQQNNPPEICKRIIDPCVDILTKYDLYVGTTKWKECCERRKDICPSPEMCYDLKNICSDITHKYYPNCCTPVPVEPCYQNVFKNVLHPYWDYCCRKYNFPRPWCDHKPNPPCIDEPCEEREEVGAVQEEQYNQSGVLLTKGRLRKRKHHHHHDL